MPRGKSSSKERPKRLRREREEEELMGIYNQREGPQNWDEIWPNWETFGKDWNKRLPDNRHLHSHEIEFLRSDRNMNKKLGQLYDIYWKEELGKGAFATVWLVAAKRYYGNNWEDLELACKVIRMNDWHIKNTTTYKEAVETSISDMLTLRYIKHENIVKIVDIITIPDSKTQFPFATICLFMELIDGNLQTLIKSYRTDPNNTATELDARCPEDLSRYWFKQIAGGVKYLHDQNIVHNDIKPDNIFYSLPTYILGFTGETASQQSLRRSIFKLGDFGRAGEHNEHIARGPAVDAQAPKTKHNDIGKLGKSLLYSGVGLRASYRLLMGSNREAIKRFDLSDGMTDLIVKMIKLNQEERVNIDEVLDDPWVTVDEVIAEQELDMDPKWEDPDNWGEDWKTQIPAKKPLLEKHMKFLRKGKQLQKTRGQLMDIKWNKELGSGAYGSVWSVRAKRYYGNNRFEDMALAGKVVQIKLRYLNTQNQSTYRAAVDYIYSDMKLLRNLRNEHIIEFIDLIKFSDKETGFPYSAVCIFMELCNGTLENLADFGPNDPNYTHTPEHMCKYWFKQILQALKYLHYRNIAHNDIKPDNIFYSYPRYITYFTGKSASKQTFMESTFKLGDFGTAAVDQTENRLTLFNDIGRLGNTLIQSSIRMSVLKAYKFSPMGITKEELRKEPFGFSEGMADLVAFMTIPNTKKRITIDGVLNHRWVTGMYLQLDPNQ